VGGLSYHVDQVAFHHLQFISSLWLLLLLPPRLQFSAKSIVNIRMPAASAAEADRASRLASRRRRRRRSRRLRYL